MSLKLKPSLAKYALTDSEKVILLGQCEIKSLKNHQKIPFFLKRFE